MDYPGKMEGNNKGKDRFDEAYFMVSQDILTHPSIQWHPKVVQRLQHVLDYNCREGGQKRSERETTHSKFTHNYN